MGRHKMNGKPNFVNHCKQLLASLPTAFSTGRSNLRSAPRESEASKLKGSATEALPSALRACVALSVLLTCSNPCAASVTAVTTPSGVTVSVDSGGPYQIAEGSPQWVFAGNTGTALTNVTASRGSDANGPYHQIAFTYTLGVARSSSIRAYDDKGAVLFSTQYLAAAANENPFPAFTSYPNAPYHVSYGQNFGLHNYSKLYEDSPWLFFDSTARAFIVSPAKNFMIASDLVGSSWTLSFGINSAISVLPADFNHQTWLVFGPGINATYDAWGNCMTNLTGKTPVANDASVFLNNLGYWTDHGAAYYYSFDSSLGYEGTLLAIASEFKQKGVPLGYMQLDSWWYPKGPNADWQDLKDGQYQYVAAPEIFPDGLAGFQARLGLPLITHARWITATSPYRSQYKMSNNVSIDPAYWSNIIGYIHNGGVQAYEQDWLALNGTPAMNLNDPPAYMNDMAAASANDGVEMQYCMPLARHFLQGSLYNDLRTMRVSGDIFTSDKWTDFLYGSKLVSALGAFPWTDVIQSKQDKSLLIQTLSAGPVGVGDPLGAVNTANVLRGVRQDGVIVKPDVSAVPLDETYLGDAQGLGMPMTAAAWTSHTGLTDLYVLSYARKSTNTITTFTPSSVGAGIAGDAYVYNRTWRSGSVLGAGESFNAPVDLGNGPQSITLFLVAPVGPSGIALLGDLGKYASLGRKRFSNVADTGTIAATVVFGTGESSVTVSGWSPTRPMLSASDGAVGAISYDTGTGLFTAPVSPGADRSAAISITRAPGVQTTIKDEAEALSVVASSPNARNGIDNSLSNGAGSFLDATGAGNLIAYNINVLQARTYDVRIGVKKDNTGGMFQLAVASSPSGPFSNHGAVQDEYSQSATSAELDLGTITFGSAGDKTFRFTVTGKNAASSNYSLCFDYIKTNGAVIAAECVWDYFCLENIPYRGRNVTVLYDKTGELYHLGHELRLLVDGQELASSETLRGLASCPYRKPHLIAILDFMRCPPPKK